MIPTSALSPVPEFFDGIDGVGGVCDVAVTWGFLRASDRIQAQSVAGELSAAPSQWRGSSPLAPENSMKAKFRAGLSRNCSWDPLGSEGNGSD